jgi:hypothetical protein
MSSSSIFRSPLRNLRPETCEGPCGEDLYADAQIRLAQWRKGLVSSANFEAHQGIRELCHEREHLKDLRTDLAGIRGLVESASQLQAGGARLAEVVQTSSEAAGSRVQAMARIRDELHESSEMRKQELEQEERNIEQRQEAANLHHAEALKLLGTYSERLGLAITRVAPQTVRMAFSLLDPCHPEREFVFTLGLGESAGKTSEGYCINDCAPHVPELPELLVQLNKDANSASALPRFVCSMRRAFLKVCSAHHTA